MFSRAMQVWPFCLCLGTFLAEFCLTYASGTLRGHLAHMQHVCVCVRMCVCVGLLRFPPNIFSLTRHLNDVILNYVFFVEIPLIQFSCLLLVCPLLCFFLPSVVVYLSSFTWRRLNVESASVFVLSFVFLWWVQFPSSFPKLKQKLTEKVNTIMHC